MHLYEIDLETANERVFVAAENAQEVLLILGNDSPHIRSMTRLTKDLRSAQTALLNHPLYPIPEGLQEVCDGLPDTSPDGVPVIGSDELVRTSKGLPPLRMNTEDQDTKAVDEALSEGEDDGI